jgi:hypothetical protein
LQKTSRRGWQSPNQEPPVSPKSDHYAYQQHVIQSPPTNLSSFSSSSSPKSISSKSNSYTLDPRLTGNSQYSKSVDSTQVLTTMYSITEKSDYRKSNISSTSSSGVATLSTSSYGNNNNNNNGYDPNSMLNYSTPTSSSNELLDESHGNNRRLSANKPVYESIKLTSSSSSASSVHAMAKQFEPTHRQKVKPAFESHYGKIQQPIAHQNNVHDRGGPVKSYDQCNGNSTKEFAVSQQHNASHQQQSFSSKPIVGNDKNCNNLNNNNNLVSHAKTNGNHTVAHLQSMNAKNNNTSNNNNGNSKIASYVPSSNGGIRTISNRGYANTNKIQQSFATIGASYYHHNHHQMQQQMPPAHSLSSPESAYSTGYSTGYSDTSPGEQLLSSLICINIDFFFSSFMMFSIL